MLSSACAATRRRPAASFCQTKSQHPVANAYPPHPATLDPPRSLPVRPIHPSLPPLPQLSAAHHLHRQHRAPLRPRLPSFTAPAPFSCVLIFFFWTRMWVRRGRGWVEGMGGGGEAKKTHKKQMSGKEKNLCHMQPSSNSCAAR